MEVGKCDICLGYRGKGLRLGSKERKTLRDLTMSLLCLSISLTGSARVGVGDRECSENVSRLLLCR